MEITKYTIEKGWNNAEKHIMHNDKTVIICRSIGASISIDQCEINATVSLEALNIYNETGLTPRELLEQRNEMRDVLEGIYENGILDDGSSTGWKRV